MKQADAGDFASGFGPLFEQPAEGPFCRSKLKPTTLEARIAELIWKHQGRANPIEIAAISEVAGVGERTVKSIVESLVVSHKMQIGARREDPAGYFILCDAEDVAAGSGPYKAQMVAMAHRLRVLLPAREMREFLGQLRLEVEG